MRAKVYIETTVVSYLTARPNRDVVIAGHQQTTHEALALARELIKAGAVPEQAAEDALHIAIAVTNGIEYLLMWNCKHLANATMRTTIGEVCRTAGYAPVVICTPEELLED